MHFYLSCLVRVKLSSYNHRKKTCLQSKVNTMPFKNSFINRLVFKNELATLYTRFFNSYFNRNVVLSFKMYISANSYICDSLYASNIPIPATTFSLLHKSATPSFIAVKPSKHSQTR